MGAPNEQDGRNGLQTPEPTWVDRAWNPRQREAMFEKTQDLFRDRPWLGLFILFQAIGAIVPFLLFLGFVVLVVVITILSAMGFIFFWIGLALFLGLLPALLLTAVLASMMFVFTLAMVVLGWVAHNVWAGRGKEVLHGIRRGRDDGEQEDKHDEIKSEETDSVRSGHPDWQQEVDMADMRDDDARVKEEGS